MVTQQEYLMKLQLLEQQANQFGEQLNIIDQQIAELEKLKEQMRVLETTNEKDIYAEIGKGIFIKAQLDKKGLLVDVGNKIFAPKTFKDIHNIIDNQNKKFDELKKDIAKRIDQISKQVDLFAKDAPKDKEKKSEKKKK